MRVVFLSDDFPPQSFGGAGFSTYELAKGVQNAGNDVFVVTTVRDRVDAGESEYNGLKLFRIATDYNERWRPYKITYNREIIRPLKEILRKVKPDVVHANNIHRFFSYYSLKISIRHAKGVIVTFRDTMALTYGKLYTKRYFENFDGRINWLDNIIQAKKRWNPLRNFLIRRYLKHAHGLFSVSGALSKALSENGILGVTTIHTGIDLKDWQIDSNSVDTFKKKFNLEKKRVILFAGRLSATKGGDRALEALKSIVKSVPETVLLFVGKEDEYAKTLRERAKKFGIIDNLVFTGWLDTREIKSAYAAADIVLVLSIYLDPFPRVVLEAMALGKSVIGTCYGGAREAILDGVTGYVIKPQNTYDVSQKVIELLNNQEKLESFGNAAKERVKTKFSLGDCVKKYVEIYEKFS